MRPRTRRRPGKRVTALERIRQAESKEEAKFTALLHHVSNDLPKRRSTTSRPPHLGDGRHGVEEPDRNIEDLHARVHRHSALPSRRSTSNRTEDTPLAIAALEDRLSTGEVEVLMRSGEFSSRMDRPDAAHTKH